MDFQKKALISAIFTILHSQSIAAPVQFAPGSAVSSSIISTKTIAGDQFTTRECSPTTLSWTQNGNNCAAQAPSSPHNTTFQANDSVAPTTGTATFTCFDGAFINNTSIASICNAPPPPPPPVPPAPPPPAPAPADCSSGTRNWTVGTNTCSASAPALTSGQSQNVTDSTAPSFGSATFTCNNGTISVSTSPAATCSTPTPPPPPPSPPPAVPPPPPAAGCPSGTRSWTVGSNTCSSNAPALSSGQSQNVTDSTAPAVGSARFTCNNGTLTRSTSPAATCSVPPPTNCSSGVRSWSKHGQNCTSTTRPSFNNGATQSATDSTTPVIGSASFTCTNGTVQFVSGNCNNVITKLSNDDGQCAIYGQSAKCWGFNADGRVGNGTTTNQLTPDQVSGLTTGVTQIATSTDFSCAIHNGAAKCWGNNIRGQLGSSSPRTSTTPIQVPGLTSGVTHITTGDSFACAIHNGAAKCWGTNGERESNLQQAGGDSPNPTIVPTLTSGVTHISAGGQQACAVHNGAAKCWGRDRLGDGTSNSRPTEPVQVLGLTSGVTQVSAGNSSSCAIHNGAAKCWGFNAFGGAGDGTVFNGTNGQTKNSPVQVIGLTSGVTQIRADERGHCALHSGSVKCWGNVGASEFHSVESSTPTQITGLTSGVTDISATCAIQNGVGKCWGNGQSGARGDDTTTNSASPTNISQPQ